MTTMSRPRDPGPATAWVQGMTLNGIEPGWYRDLFLAAAPHGFEVGESGGMLFSVGRFDPVSALDPDVRRRFQGLLRLSPTFRTMFVGPTNCDLCCLPDAPTAGLLATISAAASALRAEAVILPNLPWDVPFLPDEDLGRSAALAIAAEECGFLPVEGEELGYLELDFDSTDALLARLPQRHRQRLRRNLKGREAIRIREIRGRDTPANLVARLYRLYENVYEASDERFDKYSMEYFRALFNDLHDEGRLWLYEVDDELIGFTFGLAVADTFLFKMTGLDYERSREHRVYFVAWFHMLERCIQDGLRWFVAGGFNADVKSYLGARFATTHHLVRFRNPLWQAAARLLTTRPGQAARAIRSTPEGAPQGR